MKEKSIYALGFFDGVHLGHQALLAECCRMASELDAVPAALTFDRHPKSMYMKVPRLISTEKDRDFLLRHYGIKHVYCYPVNEKSMSLNWKAFLDELVAMGAAGFVCGDDFRFGSGGLGTPKKLEAFCNKWGIPYGIVTQRMQDGRRVSSTDIRALLEQGQLERANGLLGHPYFLTGTVVQGRQLGRTMGIPTANILLPPELAVPKLGVYACLADVDGKRYKAVTNIGSRPTVGGHQVRAESWLLDFDGDLYGKHMTLQFHAFLRPEQKFASLEELKAEIEKNAAETRKIFENT